MYAKAFVVLFAALFAFQGCVEARAPSTRVEIQARLDFEGIIQQIKDVVTAIYEKAKQTLEQLLVHANEIVSNVVAEISEKALEIFEAVKKQIAEAVSAAQAIGVNVKDCVADQEEQFEALKTQAIEDVKACTADKMAAAHDIMELVKAKFDKFHKQIEELEVKFENCEGGFTCYLQLITEAWTLLKTIPAEATEVITESFELLKKITEEVPACVTEKAKDLYNKAQEIKTTIMECIKDKMPADKKVLARKVPTGVSRLDFPDFVQQVIAHLKEVFNSLVHVISEEFNALYEKVVKFVEGVIAELTKDLEFIVSGIKAKIEELVQNAQQLGFDVKECVENQEQEFDNLYKAAQEAVKSCVADKKELLDEVISHAHSEFDRVKMEVDTLEKRFLACDEFTCFEGVVYDAYELLVSIPGRIEVTAEQVYHFVDVVYEEVPACLKEQSMTIFTQAKAIEEKIADCITDKIEG